jgi:hypothetical protein
MSIDDTTFYAWLRSDHQRVVLADMNFRVQEEAVLGSPPLTTFVPTDSFVHMSMGNYAGDRHYFDCIRSVPTFARAVDKQRLGGAASISFGSVDIDNQDGRMDFLLDLACDGSPISFSIGDPSWARADFRLMFTALVQHIAAPGPSSLTITMRDVGLLIDKSVAGDQLIGGTGPNAARPRPYLFGYVHNAECLLADFGPLLYVYANTGSVGFAGSPPISAGRVRDQGIGVVFTDNVDGTLNLAASPAGMITADLYRQIDDALPGARCSQLLDELATLAGLVAPTTLLGAHASFDVGGPDDYPVGLYLTDKTNLTDVLTQVTDTALAFWTVTRDGRFTFGRLRPNDIPSLHLPISARLTSNDVLKVDGVTVERLEPTYYGVPVIVNKNWTQQTTFAGALTADEQALYTRKGLYFDPILAPEALTYQLTPQEYHLLLVKAPAQETLISTDDDVDVLDAAFRWALARTNQFLPWIEFVDVLTDLRFFFLELGDAVVFDLDGRLGFDDHALFQVAGSEIHLDQNQIKLTLVRRRPANVTEVEYDDPT